MHVRNSTVVLAPVTRAHLEAEFSRNTKELTEYLSKEPTVADRPTETRPTQLAHMDNHPSPHVERILETALYVADLDTSRAFYMSVIGCEPMLETPRLIALSVAGRSVLLLFQRGATEESLPTAGGTVPGHGAHGVQHVAFAIEAESLDAWLARLATAGVAVESRVEWERGGVSIYVRDPDGHSIELVTPGLWAIY